MSQYRIAHIVSRPSDMTHTVAASYVIPPSLISAGYSVENRPILRGVEPLNRFDETLLELTFAEAGLRAAREGFDAVLVTPFSDYGVDMLRSIVDVPVIGGGQAAMQLAAGLGRKFAIVTVWPRLTREGYERRLYECGFTDRCSEIVHVTEDAEIQALIGADGAIRALGQDRRGKLLDRIEIAARGAIDRGADAIVFGCTCMSPIREELARRLGALAPVVDPLVAGYRLAELLLACGLRYRATGLPSSNADRLTAMIEASGSPEASGAACGDVCALLDSTPSVARTAPA